MLWNLIYAASLADTAIAASRRIADSGLIPVAWLEAHGPALSLLRFSVLNFCFCTNTKSH
jgi:hypothetical protein